MARTLPAPFGTPGWLAVGAVAVLVVVEAPLALGSPTGAVGDAVRLLLSGVAFLVPAAGVLAAIRGDRRYAVGAVVSLPAVCLYAVTGLLLPETSLSFRVGQTALEWALGLPAGGVEVAYLLFGGFTYTDASVALAAEYHGTLVALAALSLLYPAVRVGRAHGALGSDGTR